MLPFILPQGEVVTTLVKCFIQTIHEYLRYDQSSLTGIFFFSLLNELHAYFFDLNYFNAGYRLSQFELCDGDRQPFGKLRHVFDGRAR